MLACGVAYTLILFIAKDEILFMLLDKIKARFKRV